MWDAWVAGVNVCFVIDPASAIAALNHARSNSPALVVLDLIRTDLFRFEGKGL